MWQINRRKNPKVNYLHMGKHRHRFQRHSGTVKSTCHPEPRGLGRGLRLTKEKGSNSQEYEESKCLVNKILDRPHRNNGSQRGILTD